MASDLAAKGTWEKGATSTARPTLLTRESRNTLSLEGTSSRPQSTRSTFPNMMFDIIRTS